jgi:hypothetical protein
MVMIVPGPVNMFDIFPAGIPRDRSACQATRYIPGVMAGGVTG